jgi:hypothetical protein
MATWTPGPWQYDPTTRTIIGRDGIAVAVILVHAERQTVEANARLIEDAPMLFDALAEAQDLGALLLAERSWTRRTEELVRQTLERINATIARVMAWAPR